jgi:hypothetical protein
MWFDFMTEKINLLRWVFEHVPEAEKAPFLQYHNNDAAQAEKHYKTLAEMAAAGEL